MRVFLSVLIILALVGCNSNSGEVPVEENTVEVIVDSVPLVVEETTVEVIADSVPLVVEVDTVETKVEEVLNDSAIIVKEDVIRIRSDSTKYYVFSRENDTLFLNQAPFNGIIYSLNDDGILENEEEYVDGFDKLYREYYENGQLSFSYQCISYSSNENEANSYEEFFLYAKYQLMFYYETGEKKAEYYRVVNKRGYSCKGKIWYKNGKLAHETVQSEDDYYATKEICWDKEGNKIEDCENFNDNDEFYNIRDRCDTM